jgi:hypothetical protein
VVADFSVDFPVRNEADTERLERAMDAFAEKACQGEDTSGFFMVRSELRQGRSYKSIVFECQQDADSFLEVLRGDMRAA